MLENLQGLRRDRNMTQNELARLLNIHQTTYSAYEQGKTNIPIPILNQLADIFQTSIDYLLGYTDCPKPYPKRAPES